MKKIILLLLLVMSAVMARANSDQKGDDKQVTVQGCVGRSTGDYILTQQDPGNTYELQASHKIRLRQYLGQEVEVVGTKSPSMSTSSDAMARTGSPSSVTITVNSIKTIAKECGK